MLKEKSAQMFWNSILNVIIGSPSKSIRYGLVSWFTSKYVRSMLYYENFESRMKFSMRPTSMHIQYDLFGALLGLYVLGRYD